MKNDKKKKINKRFTKALKEYNEKAQSIKKTIADLHAKVEQDLEDTIEFIAHRDLDESFDWFRNYQFFLVGKSSENLSNQKELELRLNFISSQSLDQDFEIFKNE